MSSGKVMIAPPRRGTKYSGRAMEIMGNLDLYHYEMRGMIEAEIGRLKEGAAWMLRKWVRREMNALDAVWMCVLWSCAAGSYRGLRMEEPEEAHTAYERVMAVPGRGSGAGGVGAGDGEGKGKEKGKEKGAG